MNYTARSTCIGPGSVDKFDVAIVLIKRYSNRKLYDTNKKQYVSLVDIRLMIENGDKVSIQDHRSGEDITENVLTQIILTGKKDSGEVFPNSFLNEIIQTGSRSLVSFQSALINYLKNVNYFDYVPSNEDISRLNESLDELNNRLDQLKERTNFNQGKNK